MLRVAPVWMTGYAGVILLVAAGINLVSQTARNAYGLTLPAMRDSLDLSYSQAGSLITSMSVLLMVGSLSFGVLASRYGSRYIVGTMAIVSGAAMFLFGASPNYLVALAMSGVIGLASAGCTTPVMGLLSSWFAPHNRGTAAGLAASGGGISFIIVGALVPWMSSLDPVDGWRHSWYVLAGITMASGFLALAFLRDRPRQSGKQIAPRGAWPVTVYRNPTVWLIASLAFCSGWSVGLYTTFFGVYLEQNEISLEVSGRLWMLLGLLAIASGVLWGTLSDRLGRRAAFSLSFVGFGAGILLFWLLPVLGGSIVSVVLVGVSIRGTYTICAASAGDYVAIQFSAAAFGLMGVGAGLGSAIGPITGGYLADVTGALEWTFFLSVLAVAAGIGGSLFLRRPRPAVDD